MRVLPHLILLFFVVATTCASKHVSAESADGESKEVSNIKRLSPTGRGFSQVVIATGQRHVFISGQVAINENGNLVGKGDLGAQTEQVLKNIEVWLRVSGATFDDLVRMTIYVVDYDPEKREVMQRVRDRFIPSDQGPASTLVGVSKLALDDLLVEIEAQAVIGSDG